MTQDTVTADVAVRLVARERATVGDVIDYQIRIRNLGPGDATDVWYWDRVPEGGHFVSASGGGELDPSGVVRWPALERLGAGSQVFDTVRIRYDTAGRYRNTVSVSSGGADPDSSNNSATEQTTVSEPPVADLQIVKRGPEFAAAGETVEYVITTTNLGPDLADWIYVSDQLAEGAVFVAASRGATATDGVVEWEMIHILQAGASVVDTVWVVLPRPGSYTNTASVTQITDDPDVTNDRSSVTTTVPGEVDLGLSQLAQPESFTRGGAGSFTLRVRNLGTEPTSGPITVTSVIPEGVTVVRRTSDGPWTFVYDSESREHVATSLETLEADVLSAFSILIDVDMDPAGPTEVTHTGVVATEGDNNPSNDTATVTVPINTPRLTLRKRALRSDVSIGDFVTYVLTVRNDGSEPLTSVRVTDQPPSGFRLTGDSVSVDEVRIGVAPGSVLQIPVGTLEPDQERTVRYRLLVGAGTPLGDARNTAFARDSLTGAQSPPATATVRVRGDGVFTEEGLIVGKVFAEVDSVRLGIPGVRIFLQDGRSAITDSQGNYNFVGLRPRLWVVRVDQSTLPAPGALKLRPLTNRNVGRGSSVFADLVKGEMHRVDFGAYVTAEDMDWDIVVEQVEARRARAGRAEGNRGGGITWPVLNGWVRDSSPGAGQGLPSAFGEILPGGLINAGNSGLGARPADPVAAGLIGARATQDGPLRLVLDSERAVAHGDSAVSVTLSMDPTPEAGSRPVTVTLEASRGRWEATDLDPVAPGLQVSLSGSRTLRLRAPGSAGDGTVRATALGREVALLVPWSDENRRPFLVTGLLEGQFDARSLENAELFGGVLRDRLQDPIREIAFDSDDGRYTGGLRAAAFATGDIGDETSLTLRFDTEKDEGRRFFDDIRPQDFYGVYGDGSVKGFGTQSRGRVFGALERGRSYVMYGDFVTGSGRGEAQTLGRYSRTLNGLAHHFEKSMGSVGLRVDGFASYGRVNQVVDEIRGLGISGPYALSRTDGLLNSEKVELVVRDRNQPSIILRRERLTRFLDYSVEPFTGRLLFKRPIPSLDDQFNPVSVRVTYEVEEWNADRFWVYGVDGALRASDRLEVGGGLVRDDSSVGGIDLSSAGATLGLTRNTFLFGEFARSDSADVVGDAARVELRHGSSRVDARAYYVETDRTFSNRSSGFSGGRKEAGLRGRADITSRIQVLGEALRTESLLTGGRREGLQIGVRAGGAWSAEVGYRYAEETGSVSAETAGVSPYDLNSLRGRVTAPLPEEVEGAVFAEYEQDVQDSNQRRLVIGGDLRLFARARVYGRHELISSLVGPYGLNPLQEQNNTVFGVAADYKAGTQIFSEYRARDAFAGREAQAAMGLRNQWSMADGVRLNTSFERLSPLGLEGRDALAVTGALEYTANPLWKGTVRSEYRSSGDQDHLLGSLGYAGRLTEDWTLLGQSVFSHVLDGPTYERSRIGLAYRDIQSNRWNGLWRYEHRYDDKPEAGIDWSRKAHILSTHFDYRPMDRFTLRGQYGAKYVTEGDNGQETSEPSSLVGARFTYDLDDRFDVGVTGWALRTGGLLPAGGRITSDGDATSSQSRYAVGAELGWTASRDLRISAGYNAFGFVDDDLVPDQPTDQGFYVKVGFKADWLGGAKPAIERLPADMSLSKHGPSQVVVGKAADYWLFPRNEGPNRARRVELREAVPAGARVVEVSEGAEVLGDTIRWQLGDLPPGDAPSQFVRLVFPDTGVVVNEARVSSRSPDGTPLNNSGTHRTEVVPYELRITKSGPATARADKTVTYTVTVTNLGPRRADSVVVEDSLPAGAVFVDASDEGQDVDDQGETDGVVTWPAQRLAVGSSVTFTIDVRYTMRGRYRNTILTNAPISPTRAYHDIEIGVAADVRVDLFGPERSVVGDQVDYGLHVYNGGLGVARNVRVQQQLPPGARIDSISGGGTAFNRRVTWPAGSLDPGGEHFFRIWARYDSVGLYRSEARVFSDFDDRSETDWDATETLVAGWDLDVEVTQSAATTDGVVDYVIRVENRGPDTAPHVVVEDSVAAGGRFVDAGRSAVEFGDIVRWPAIRSLAGGAVHVDTLRIRYGRAGRYRNVGTASAQGYAVSDAVETPVRVVADVRVQQFGPLLAQVGDTVEYGLHVHNRGSGVARNVSVRDEIPGGALVQDTSPGAARAGDTLTWQLGDLEPGADAFLTLRVTYRNPGLFRNRAVVASELDPNSRNDASSLATRVDLRGAPRILPVVPPPTLASRRVRGLLVTSAGPSVASVGESTAYGAVAVNGALGPVDAVRLSVGVPPGATVSNIGSGGAQAGDSMIWNLGRLEPGEQRFTGFELTYSATGAFRIGAVLADAGQADRTAVAAGRDHVTTRVVEGVPGISLTGPALVREDEPAAYIIRTVGNGAGAAFGIVVEDSLPDGATFRSASRGGELQGRVVRWPALSALDAGASVTDTLWVSFAERGRYRNVATTSPRFPGVRAELETAVGTSADLRADLFGVRTVLVGRRATYEVHVYNGGTGEARNVDVVLELASGSELVSVTDGGLAEGGVVTWPKMASMRPGEELFATVVVTYGQPGNYRHLVRAVSEFDPRSMSDEATFATEVRERRISVELRLDNRGDVNVTDTVTYVIETVFDGPEPFRGATLQDILPAGAVFVGASGGGVYGEGVVRWNLGGALLPGVPRRETVQMTFPHGGLYTNVAVAEGESLLDSATVELRVHPDNDPTPAVVHFEFDQDDLTARTQADLIQIAQQMRFLSPSIRIGLFGHADTVGTSAYNDDLGQRRADRVAAFLDSLGVRIDRVATFSLGEQRPVSTEGTRESHARDRRVELRFCHSDQPQRRDRSATCSRVLGVPSGRVPSGSDSDLAESFPRARPLKAKRMNPDEN